MVLLRLPELGFVKLISRLELVVLEFGLVVFGLRLVGMSGVEPGLGVVFEMELGELFVLGGLGFKSGVSFGPGLGMGPGIGLKPGLGCKPGLGVNQNLVLEIGWVVLELGLAVVVVPGVGLPLLLLMMLTTGLELVVL